MGGPGAGAAVAAIDCGTNSTRLLILGPDDEVLERQMRITRLGEGVDATRRLSEEAIERTVSVLRDYRGLMERHGVRGARLAATSATRDATNSEQFFEAAEAATALRPELLSGDDEARLSFEGATAHLSPRWREEGTLLVVDIGGGSTELAVGDVSEPSRNLEMEARDDVASVSLDMGCVRISERFLAHDPPAAAEMAEARSFIEDALGRARDRLPPLPKGGTVVGLAGTVSTVAALEARLEHYDRSAVHGAVLSRTQVHQWLEQLAREDRARRLARPGMARGREDVIVGGVMILDVVMDVFDRERCLVSEDDILDGLAASVRADAH